MRVRTIAAVAAVFLAACSGSDGSNTPETTETIETIETIETVGTGSGPVATGTPPTDPPTTGPQRSDPPNSELIDVEQPADLLLEDPFAIVEELASDELNGRNNLTGGSAAAREILLSRLVGVAEPVRSDLDGADGFLQPYGDGTNVVGILPGRGELAEEYVLVGAHYDHLGECDTRGEPADAVCNGAADNAAGVGVVISIVNSIRYRDLQAPVLSDGAADETDQIGRRSLIVGLWDGEEDGLVGSRTYVNDPFVPLEQTVASVNFDIQGAQLTPQLANTTLLVGPETGGAVLVDAVRRATEASALDFAVFSLVFGQGRSDHAVLAAAGVPSVFFTDANNGCYHTVLDDVEHLDRDKFSRQVDTAQSFVDDLLTMEVPPTFVSDADLTTYADAAALLELVQRAEPDFGLLPGDGPATSAEFLLDLETIVDAGPDAYDDAAGGIVLGGAAVLVEGLAQSECVVPS